MGIQGLLPQLKSIMVPIHAKDLTGQTVAVDTYSWLHKGALSCSRELCKGLPTSRHIDYCMHRVNLLRHFGVKPILVFDGGLLPMKIEQENKRSRARKENLERALEHEFAGNSAAAYECYQKAVDISPSIAHDLIQVLKEENVDYIVAPYEADAQMAFLALQNFVDVVITEDSDLIPFGCSRVVYKMDKFGQGVEFCYSSIGKNRDLNFAGFTKQMFLEMCILSGCDYLQSLPGMGLKRAHALIQKFKSYDKVIKHLRYSAVSVPPLYEEGFKKAILTFRHQRVYDPKSEDIVHLSAISHDVDHNLDFLGPSVPQVVMKGIANGYIDPFTKLPFEDERIHDKCMQNKTYSLKEFKPTHERRTLDLPAQKNVLTNYFCMASLEAKRKYRAPQVHCKQFLMEKSPGDDRHMHEDKRFSKFFPRKDKCVESDEKASSNVIDKTFDKSFPTADMAYQGKISNDSSLHQQSEATEALLVSHNKHNSCSASVLEGNAMPKDQTDISKKSYMPEKLDSFEDCLKTDGEDRNHRTILHQEPADENLCHHPIFSSDSTENYCSEAAKRRKIILSQNEIELKSQDKEKPMVYVGTPFSSEEGLRVHNSVHKAVEQNVEQKLQCDISHLSRYSRIAENSMEKFVSVISSFKYVSSGSRASGLRAPLKDVQNTSRGRSPLA